MDIQEDIGGSIIKSISWDIETYRLLIRLKKKLGLRSNSEVARLAIRNLALSLLDTSPQAMINPSRTSINVTELAIAIEEIRNEIRKLREREEKLKHEEPSKELSRSLIKRLDNLQKMIKLCKKDCGYLERLGDTKINNLCQRINLMIKELGEILDQIQTN